MAQTARGSIVSYFRRWYEICIISYVQLQYHMYNEVRPFGTGRSKQTAEGANQWRAAIKHRSCCCSCSFNHFFFIFFLKSRFWTPGFQKSSVLQIFPEILHLKGQRLIIVWLPVEHIIVVEFSIVFTTLTAVQRPSNWAKSTRAKQLQQ